MSASRIDVELTTQTGELIKFDVPVLENVSLLELFEDAGVRSPFGCRVGTCGTCVVRILQGAELIEDTRQMEDDTLARVSTSETFPTRLACRASFKRGAQGKLVLEKIVIR